MPYPNVAAGPMAVGAAYKVLFGGTPAHGLSTVVPLTNGDNAGVGRGVMSGMVMGQSQHVTGATTVLVGGSCATRQSSVTKQNGTNCAGVRLVPSQLKVLLLAP